ncbi:hypothetical protein QW060_20045 [Myroides ceti]|uniref:Uncharacterized protein n=1 Tax=Paenimyroides ceti TaxID=395087 RepID=A0ABT8CZX4_9FLAO|nr:hypothetical protein [Paenimyroides ceti]MDN3709311.1 hypothetical protein [Paenimyroides ceti]
MSGAHTDKENYNYLDIAEQTYIEKSQRYLQQEGLTVSNITKQLQATLQQKQKELQEGIKFVATIQNNTRTPSKIRCHNHQQFILRTKIRRKDT